MEAFEPTARDYPPSTGRARRVGGAPATKYSPILGRTLCIHQNIAPIVYDCVMLIFVHDGSAVLLGEFGERPVTVGGVIVLGANTLCGSEPEGSITVTTLYRPQGVLGQPDRREA